jgi:hypothetical protein
VASIRSRRTGPEKRQRRGKSRDSVLENQEGGPLAVISVTLTENSPLSTPDPWYFLSIKQRFRRVCFSSWLHNHSRVI